MKLTVELIPRTCSGSNIRTLIPSKYWNNLRKHSYKSADYQCQICGGKGTEQGYRHDLECHEIWEYNVRHRVQKLVGLISLCPLCHQTKHIGRAKYIGKRDEVIKHMKKINKTTKRSIEEYLEGEFERYSEHSRIKWKLDLSLLLEMCDIKKEVIESAENKRLLENTKPPKSYRKKKKTTKKKITPTENIIIPKEILKKVRPTKKKVTTTTKKVIKKKKTTPKKKVATSKRPKKK